MPCDTIQLSQVEFLATSTDANLLAKGLKTAGFNVMVYADSHTVSFSKGGRRGTYNSQTGELEIPQSWDSNEIKRAYSQAVVSYAAEQYGWTLTEESPGVYQAERNF